MNTIETIQHVRDIDPDYPACTVLLKGRIAKPWGACALGGHWVAQGDVPVAKFSKIVTLVNWRTHHNKPMDVQ